MDIEYTLSSVLVGISWAVSLVVLLKYVFDVKLSAPAALFYIASISGLFIATFMVFDDSMVEYRTGVITVYIFVLILLKLKKLQKSVMIFSVYVVILSAAETVDIMLVYNVFEYTPITCFIINTVSMQVFTAAACGIKKLLIRLVNAEKTDRETKTLTILAATSIFLATYVQLEFEYSLLKGEDMNPKTYGLFLAITAVTYLAAAIAAMGFIKSASEERKNRIITEQQRILEEMHDGTRVFRHNYKNTLIAIKGYCDTGDYDKLSERIDELYNEMDDIYSSGQFRNALNISDAGFRNLIMLKTLEARKRGIAAELRVEGERFDAFESMNMLNAVGALLDNAIESAAASKEKYIALELFTDSEKQRVIISNSIDEKPDMSRIMSKDYSTKNQSGLGLYYVSRVIARRKNMDIAFNCSDKLFYVCLETVEEDE